MKLFSNPRLANSCKKLSNEFMIKKSLSFKNNLFKNAASTFFWRKKATEETKTTENKENKETPNKKSGEVIDIKKCRPVSCARRLQRSSSFLSETRKFHLGGPISVNAFSI